VAAGCDFSAVVTKDVAAGGHHSMFVTSKCILLGWGKNECGQLGQDNIESNGMPEKSEMNTFGDAGAAMVAWGAQHTVVLATSQCVWTCGDGVHGQLGHGDLQEMRGFTLVREELFLQAKIVMVACGDQHSVALDVEATLWVWGENEHGQLGLNDHLNRWLPARVLPSNVHTVVPAIDEVIGQDFGGHVPVLVTAGGAHTAVVTEEGSMWVTGCGANGRLGLHVEHTKNSVLFRWVGTDQTFCGSHVLMAACGKKHTLAVTKK